MVIVKVFVNISGEYGNPVGLIIDDGKRISGEERQKTATESGFSEIVYINNFEENDISIFSPTREIPFAGHAVIGTVFFIEKHKGGQITNIQSMGLNIDVKHELEKIWVRAELSKMPKWNFKQLETVNEVEALTISNTTDLKHCVIWSWISKTEGVIRARTFAPDWLIPEDEANGSGALLLSTILQKEIKVIHGKGSIIFAKPVDSNFGEVGGICKMSI
jgi:predicted PhzF superfamily epimerase YddE/YHI9